MSNRIVKLPSVESFGRLTPDKWLLLKTLEEAAEMVEAGKQYLKASDPTDPSGIGREFDDHANCLACFGVNVGGELGDDRDKAKAGWIGYVRDQRRQAMLGELADVLQTVGNLIAAFGITDERSGTGDGRLSGTQSGKRSAVSIISSEAKWAVLQRVVRLSPEEIRGTTKGKEYEAGFIAGATRRPTNEEIVAGAKAFYEALKPDYYPQWDSDCALRAEYYDAMRLAVKAMQGKAAEE